MFRQASLSADDAYRYTLTRWDLTDEGVATCHRRGYVAWLMLNPSTADAEEDDPTVRRCIAFTRAWGYDHLVVVNLFALRSTDPAALKAHPYPVGEANDGIIEYVCGEADRIVCAWGTKGGLLGRDRLVLARLRGRNIPTEALAITQGGMPKHPLYVRGDTLPVPYGPDWWLTT